MRCGRKGEKGGCCRSGWKFVWLTAPAATASAISQQQQQQQRQQHQSIGLLPLCRRCILISKHKQTDRPKRRQATECLDEEEQNDNDEEKESGKKTTKSKPNDPRRRQACCVPAKLWIHWRRQCGQDKVNTAVQLVQLAEFSIGLRRQQRQTQQNSLLPGKRMCTLEDAAMTVQSGKWARKCHRSVVAKPSHHWAAIICRQIC